MEQIRYTSNLGSEFLATFDGAVLEIFGPTDEHGSSPESQRYHRDLMSVEIEEPDRKGNLKIAVYAGSAPSRRVPSMQVRINEQDRQVLDFFGRVRAALPT